MRANHLSMAAKCLREAAKTRFSKLQLTIQEAHGSILRTCEETAYATEGMCAVVVRGGIDCNSGRAPGRMDGARSTAGRSGEGRASAAVGASETADRPAEWPASASSRAAGGDRS